ncbi:hypothetical protein EAH_00019260 [Eimeria acervulina]|uniref:Uncharacterized protein n=1 Tax=Eimeria acervulina TaxID=5801 RepID=U6G982_EIMAC|nr:hypothetical protein EAH_00019260 [Eimeria acervulina]CDI76690.1 hypothetical protein EAH_00019260 [Eimeria acervulina]
MVCATRTPILQGEPHELKLRGGRLFPILGCCNTVFLTLCRFVLLRQSFLRRILEVPIPGAQFLLQLLVVLPLQLLPLLWFLLFVKLSLAPLLG